MYSGKTHILPRLSNYKRAHEYFEKTKLPPRSKKWSEYQRPLKDARSHHYRIERHTAWDDSFYDLVLYQTTLARLHKPDAEGNERCQYINHYSQTSQGFLRDVANIEWLNRRTTTDERTVVAPVSTRPLPGEDFSTDLWFAPSGKLIVERSRHTRIFRKVSSDADKAARKKVKAALDGMLTLIAMRIPEFAADVKFDFYMAGVFNAVEEASMWHRHSGELVRALEKDLPPPQAALDTLMEQAQLCFDKIASNRAFAAGLISYRNISNARYSDIEPIDEKTLINSLWSKLKNSTRLSSTSGYIEYPQFPGNTEIVRSNITTNNK
jgi:hypothetical protein